MIAANSLRRMLLMFAATAVFLFGLTAFFGGTAQAEEGISPIGPGYSDNHAGVICIQKFLGVEMKNGTPYGTYGRVTNEAVKEFQATHPPLEVDGAVGPATATAMLKAGMSPSCRNALPTGSDTGTSSTKSAGSSDTTGSAGDTDKASPTPGDSAPSSGETGAPTPAVPSPSTPPADKSTPGQQNTAAGQPARNLTGKYANKTGCDTDAYTVKTAPMVIEQKRPTASEKNGNGSVTVKKDEVGVTLGGGSRSEYTTVEATVGTIEVRYSPSCHTAWTRVSPEDESSLSGVAITDGLHRENRDIHPRIGKGDATKPGNYISPMITVSPTTRVLGSLDGNAGGGAHLAGDGKPSTGWVVPASASPIGQ